MTSLELSGVKRKSVVPYENNSGNLNEKQEDTNESPEKKVKMKYELEKSTEKLITADKVNKMYWDDCMELLDKGKKVCIGFKYFAKHMIIILQLLL